MLELLLQQYTSLLEDLNDKCAKAQKLIPEIPCKKGCFDCCKQLFPLSLIEAFYINDGFQLLPAKIRDELKESAKTQQKHIASLNLKQYEISSDSLEDIAENRNELRLALQSTKIDCPLLTKDGICNLYPQRNHDCRIHGAGFDTYNAKIIGCHRHNKIFDTLDLKKKFITHAIDSSYRYKEKSKLDSLLTVELSQNPDLKYCYYFTTPYTPLLKDYRKTDWPKFFKDKAKASSHKYSLIIDLEPQT